MGPALLPGPPHSPRRAQVAQPPRVCVGGVRRRESQSHPPLPENLIESASGYVWSQGATHPSALNLQNITSLCQSPPAVPRRPARSGSVLGTGLGPGPAQSKQGYECLSFCFFLFLWTEVVWFFPLLKLFPHIELLTFLLVRKCDYYFKLGDSRKLFKKDPDEF